MYNHTVTHTLAMTTNIWEYFCKRWYLDSHLDFETHEMKSAMLSKCFHGDRYHWQPFSLYITQQPMIQLQPMKSCTTWIHVWLLKHLWHYKNGIYLSLILYLSLALFQREIQLMSTCVLYVLRSTELLPLMCDGLAVWSVCEVSYTGDTPKPLPTVAFTSGQKLCSSTT